MATIMCLADLPVSPARAWAPIEQWTRAEDHFFSLVAHVELRDGARHITTTRGGTLVERLVSVDPGQRRAAYTIPGYAPGVTRHLASFHVLERPGGESTLLWTTDIDSDEVAARARPNFDRSFADLLAACR